MYFGYSSHRIDSATPNQNQMRLSILCPYVCRLIQPNFDARKGLLNLTLLSDDDRFASFSASEKLIMQRVVPSVLQVLLLLTFIFAWPTNAVAADKSELYRLSKELVRVHHELDKLESRQIDKSLLAQFQDYISTLADEQVAGLAEQYKDSIANMQVRIKAIKAPPPVRSKTLLGELDGLRDEYKALLRTYKAELSRNKRLKPIFIVSPYQRFDEQYELDTDDLPPEGKELEVYRLTIGELKMLHEQINSISAKDISNVLKNVGSSWRLHELATAHTALNKDAMPLVERLERYKREAENNIDDARMNCSAERPDFDCASRCEQSVRDPIFGTYRMEPNFSCLRNCQSREQQAMNSLNSKVSDCVEARDEAREVVRDAKENYEATHPNLVRMQERLNGLRAEAEEVVGIRNDVMKLHDRLHGAIRSSLVKTY